MPLSLSVRGNRSERTIRQWHIDFRYGCKQGVLGPKTEYTRQNTRMKVYMAAQV